MGNILYYSMYDTNGDGVVTKKEMEDYINDKVFQYKKEREDLQLAYENLMKKYNELLKEKHIETNIKISDEKIKETAVKILEDPKTNISGFPDIIERRIYENVFKIFLNTLAGATETSNIIIAGHRLKLLITPYEN